MTEGTCVTSTQPVTSWKYGSVGVLVPNTIAKVLYLLCLKWSVTDKG